MTNGDRIRNMSDEELAIFLDDDLFSECYDCPARDVCEDDDECSDAIMKWLGSITIKECAR